MDTHAQVQARRQQEGQVQKVREPRAVQPAQPVHAVPGAEADEEDLEDHGRGLVGKEAQPQHGDPHGQIEKEAAHGLVAQRGVEDVALIAGLKRPEAAADPQQQQRAEQRQRTAERARGRVVRAPGLHAPDEKAQQHDQRRQQRELEADPRHGVLCGAALDKDQALIPEAERPPDEGDRVARPQAARGGAAFSSAFHKRHILPCPSSYTPPFPKSRRARTGKARRPNLKSEGLYGIL